MKRPLLLLLALLLVAVWSPHLSLALRSPISDADYLLLGSPAPLAACPAPPGKREGSSSSSPASSTSSSVPVSVNVLASSLWRALPYLGSAVPSRLFAPEEDIPKGPYWRSFWERLSVNVALLLAAAFSLLVFAVVAASRSCRGRRLRKEHKRHQSFPLAPPLTTRSSYAQTFLEGEEGAGAGVSHPPVLRAKTRRSWGFTLVVAAAATLALVAAVAACYGLSRAESKLLLKVEALVDDVKYWFSSLSDGIEGVRKPLRAVSGFLSAAADALAAAAPAVPAAATAASSLRDASSAASDATTTLDDACTTLRDISGSITEIWESTIDPIVSKVELGRLVVTLSLLAAAALAALSLAASCAFALPAPKEGAGDDDNDDSSSSSSSSPSSSFPLSSKRQRLRKWLAVSACLSLFLFLLLAFLGTVYLAIALLGHDACANAEPQLLARTRAAAGSSKGNTAAATVAFYLYGPAPAARLSTILKGLPPSLSPGSFDPLKELFDLDAEAAFAEAVAAAEAALTEIGNLPAGGGGGAGNEVAAAVAAAEAAIESITFASLNLTALRETGALSPTAVRALYAEAKQTACCGAVDGSGSLWLSTFVSVAALLLSAAAAGALLEKAETRAQRRARALAKGKNKQSKKKDRERDGESGSGLVGAVVSPSLVPLPSRPPPPRPQPPSPVPALKKNGNGNGNGDNGGNSAGLLPFPSLETQGSWNLSTRAAAAGEAPPPSQSQKQPRSVSWGPTTVVAAAAAAPSSASSSSSFSGPSPSAPPLSPPPPPPSSNGDDSQRLSRSSGPVRVSASVFWSLHRKGKRCDDPTVVDLSGESVVLVSRLSFSLFSAALLRRIFFFPDRISAGEIVLADLKQDWLEKGAGFGAGASDRWRSH